MANPLHTLHKQRLAILIVSFIGVASGFLVWMYSNIPARGNLTGVDMGGRFSQFLFLVTTLMALSGTLADRLPRNPFFLTLGIGGMVVLLGVINVFDAAHLIVEQTGVYDIRIGPGLWLNMLCGAVLLALTWWLGRKPANPNS